MPMTASRARRPAANGEGMSPIIEHPDVMRNLLTMKSMIRAQEAFAIPAPMRSTWPMPAATGDDEAEKCGVNAPIF